jgi:tetratricopeptide (TPR) repeat protein
MFVRIRLFRDLFALFCLIGFGTQLSFAASKDPTTWWPDPSTGLMWTGQAIPATTWTGNGMGWQKANDYCASLQLGGYANWRLPTLNEVKAETEIIHVYPNEPPDRRLFFKNGLNNLGLDQYLGIWTSTPSLDAANSVWVANLNFRGLPFGMALMAWPILSVMCVRPMEADLLQIAKDAQVNKPVPDLQTLKDYALLGKVRLAYQAGQYQESIAQAKNALLVKPDFAPAYWAIGISYGMLDQWDLAITNLEAALKIDNNYVNAKDSLKWAKEGQSAAKKGKSPKAQSPQWN